MRKLSVVCMALGIALAVHIGSFLLTSSSQGAALVRKEHDAIAAAARNSRGCTPSQPATAAPDGLLRIPAVGLVAPVLQGTGDPVLNVAVGHDPASVWPGQPGTSVLSAHNVTWFSGIGQLTAGDAIRYITPCETYVYTVTSHDIVSAGSPVYDTSSRLVLDTCYPFNALYITDSRYLVSASYAGSVPTAVADRTPPARWPVPAVPAPAPLAAQGLSLAANEVPLGTLRLAGTPSSSWRQSDGEFRFEAAALSEYFGLLRSAEVIVPRIERTTNWRIPT